MSKFRSLLEEVSLNTESARSELADLLAEELDDAANTFDNFVTPEADPKPMAEDDDPEVGDDDSVLSAVGAEVAADAIEDLANVSDNDGPKFDTQIIDDETGDDITDDIKAEVDDAESGSDDPSDDDAVSFDSGDDAGDDLGDSGDAGDDMGGDDLGGDGDDADLGDDTGDDVGGDEAEITDDDLKDIDPDDLLGGAFDEEDELIMDDVPGEIGDVTDAAEDAAAGGDESDVDDLVESLLNEVQDEKVDPSESEVTNESADDDDEGDAELESLLSDVVEGEPDFT